MSTDETPIPLEYRKPERRYLTRRAKILFGVVVVAAMAWVLDSVPVHRVYESSICQICGERRRTTTWDVWGRRIWTRSSEETTGASKEYQMLIALQHVHRWHRGAGISSEHGSVWRSWSIGCGGDGGNLRLIEDGLWETRTLGATLPVAERQQIYQNLLHAKLGGLDPAAAYEAEQKRLVSEGKLSLP